MMKQGSGSIVFISSIGGFLPIPVSLPSTKVKIFLKYVLLLQMIMPYSVSKTALLGLTKALSFELGPDNIRVNCIAPGIIDTKFSGAVSR